MRFDMGAKADIVTLSDIADARGVSANASDIKQ
jgi:hypothetical protein